MLFWKRNPFCKVQNRNHLLVALLFQAKAVFDHICPGEEFLPKAPNPEDIIFDDGAAASNEGSGFEADQQGAEQPMQNIQTDKASEEISESGKSASEGGEGCTQEKQNELEKTAAKGGEDCRSKKQDSQ